MAISTIWWLLAGALIATELVTGTFYLLMVAFGFVAAALSAHLDATVSKQLMVAAGVSGGLVLAWRGYKKRMGPPLPANANHDVNMDIGEVLDVTHWDENGTSQVKYRGANWQVSLCTGDVPLQGKHQIIEVIGSRLIVRKI